MLSTKRQCLVTLSEGIPTLALARRHPGDGFQRLIIGADHAFFDFR